MIETLSEGLSKCRWLCFIILVAFSIESYANPAIITKALSELIENNNLITVINNTLTGVVVLSFCVLLFHKLQMNNSDDTAPIYSFIQIADFKSVTEWAMLFKWAFVLLQYNRNDPKLLNCIFSGWYPVYWLPIGFILILFFINKSVRNS